MSATEQRFTVAQSDLYFDIKVDYASRRIAVEGEFDVATAPSLATAVARFQRAAPGDITVDLADVTFIDAAGLGALTAARAAQLERGDRLTVDRITAEVRRLFAIAQITDLLDGEPAANANPDQRT
jgi:anti-sigma B factor antagonist